MKMDDLGMYPHISGNLHINITSPQHIVTPSEILLDNSAFIDLFRSEKLWVLPWVSPLEELATVALSLRKQKRS